MNTTPGLRPAISASPWHECWSLAAIRVASVPRLSTWVRYRLTDSTLSKTQGVISPTRVSYLRSSAERIAVRDNTYDLVYSYATMEHVPDIEAAFREFVRVTQPGGIIYSLAAPLWNSRFGRHKGGIFASFP
jgi:SAM-dependent methyltransferase